MPLGIISEDDLKTELDKLKSKKEVVVIDAPKKGGYQHINQSVRNFVAAEGVLGADRKLLQRDLGISESVVDNLAVGIVNGGGVRHKDKRTLDVVDRVRYNLGIKARRVMRASMDGITDEKLGATDARDLAAIAKDMAVIDDKLNPVAKQGSLIGNAEKVLIYRPRIKEEDSYDTIQVVE